MKNVREHLKDYGFDLKDMLSISYLDDRAGTMECESIDVEVTTFRLKLTEKALVVRAVARIPTPDGELMTYPVGWPKYHEASVTAYFPFDLCADKRAGGLTDTDKIIQ